MKANASFLGFSIAVILTILSFWGYTYFFKKKSDHIIDNPSRYTINIQLDKDHYILAPQQQVKLHLSKGEHLITVKTDKDSLLIEQQPFTVKKDRGTLNPTLSTYFIFALPYGLKVNKDSIFAKNTHFYKGKTYYGELSIDSSLYIENFYYNLNETFPKVIKKSENKSLRTKIFRENDFKQYYFENFE